MIRIPSFLEVPVLALFDLCNRGLCARAKKILIDDFKDVRRPQKGALHQATIVYGAGVVSGVVARRVAILKARGLLGDTFYFSGGLPVRSCEFAKWLMPSIVKSGISAPNGNEREGPYAKRVFEEQLDKLGVDRSNLTIIVEDQGKHFQAHLQNLKRLGADKHQNYALVALPYGRLRAVGTFYHEYGKQKRVTPVPAWLPELGITEKKCEAFFADQKPFWKKLNVPAMLTRVMCVLEAKKFGLPTQQKSPYGRGNRFCTCYSLDRLKRPVRVKTISSVQQTIEFRS